MWRNSQIIHYVAWLEMTVRVLLLKLYIFFYIIALHLFTLSYMHDYLQGFPKERYIFISTACNYLKYNFYNCIIYQRQNIKKFVEVFKGFKNFISIVHCACKAIKCMHLYRIPHSNILIIQIVQNQMVWNTFQIVLESVS